MAEQSADNATSLHSLAYRRFARNSSLFLLMR
ncbi:hypothetical protein [Escherichia coli]